MRLDQPGRVSRGAAGPARRRQLGARTRGASRFDVDVAAAYGVPLPRAAADVREQVAAAVIGMTGLPVRSVDVTVTGVER